MPIGTPIAFTEAWVLDGRGQLAPLNTLGELALGGVNALAEGYLGAARPSRPKRNSCPTPSPAGPAPASPDRDLVRVLPGGEIDFIGRKDHQVKAARFPASRWARSRPRCWRPRACGKRW